VGEGHGWGGEDLVEEERKGMREGGRSRWRRDREG
jgi:hypothetical protein